MTPIYMLRCPLSSHWFS